MTRIRPRFLLVGAMALGAIGLVLFAQVGVHTGFWSLVLPAEVVTGLGLAWPPLTSTALLGVAAGDAGVTSGLFNAGQQVGSSLGVALLNTIAATAATSYVASHGLSTWPGPPAGWTGTPPRSTWLPRWSLPALWPPWSWSGTTGRI